MDAGWVYLTQLIDLDNVVANFKQTDLDPREIILLFKELYESSYRLNDYLLKKPTYFMPKIIEQAAFIVTFKVN